MTSKSVSLLGLEKYTRDSCSFSSCLIHCFEVIRSTCEALSKKLEVLRSALKYNATGSSQPEEIQAKQRYADQIYALSSSDRFIGILVAFDHTLAETEDKIKETCFVVRFHRFHHTHSIWFSFLPLARLRNLLSRVGVTSNRINSGDLLMPRPYMYLRFDQLMQSRKVFE